MNIRAINAFDFGQLTRIHEKFYKDEFELPDFLTNFLCAFTIEKDGRIITTGGVRTIVESIAVTNKDCSIRERREALYKLMEACKYVAISNQYEHLHAFIQDESWQRHLINAGFEETKGQSLILHI